METPNIYQTDDLGLASYLYACGVKFRGVGEPVDGSDWKVTMDFDAVPADVLEDWHRGTALINASAMWQASRRLTRALKRR